MPELSTAIALGRNGALCIVDLASAQSICNPFCHFALLKRAFGAIRCSVSDRNYDCGRIRFPSPTPISQRLRAGPRSNSVLFLWAAFAAGLQDGLLQTREEPRRLVFAIPPSLG